MILILKKYNVKYLLILINKFEMYQIQQDFY